ncbi:LrgB family protein [Cohnella sp. AR92]|uniref:LrgB family protein n=1 Tax=Cohnella sp. AR92 TaxID=648716 RepID=UPI000F8D58F4|nr:LrgB family protein [Cohnella sp. AR92]RUS46654.1 LrgB family protein [Cohnella sp. AR92]
MSNWSDLTGEPIFGISLTLGAYVLALRLNRRWKWLHPLFACTGVLIVLLLAADIPYESYSEGGDLITFFLGPTTVALAVPLYKSLLSMRKHLKAVAIGVTLGSVAGLCVSSLIVMAFGGSKELLVTLLPKSVTTPIAIELSRQLGGSPQLTGVFTVLTGLLGSMFGPALLKLFRIRSDLAIGAAVGTSAHGIGTGRLARESEAQAGISGFAMSLAGMIMSILGIPLAIWLS